MTQPSRGSALQDKAFLVLLIAVSLAFAWILLPFYGAILWAVILATVFVPVERWLGSVLPER
ncbi:MAG: AI-2E family transporter, partial [Alphaproteobacteria bacterium]